MNDQRVTLTEHEVAYLLHLVRDDIVDAVTRGDGGINLILFNRLGNMHARNCAAAPPSPVHPDGAGVERFR